MFFLKWWFESVAWNLGHDPTLKVFFHMYLKPAYRFFFSLPTFAINFFQASLDPSRQVVQKYIKSITNNASGAPKGRLRRFPFFLGLRWVRLE